MSIKSNKLLLVIFVAVSLLFANGCVYFTKNVTVEIRFLETRQPVQGSLSYMFPVIAWPKPPSFEPVASSDGLFEINLINNHIWCEFLLSNHGELENPYGFPIYFNRLEITERNNQKKSNWEVIQSPNESSSSSSLASYPEIEYRLILSSKESN